VGQVGAVLVLLRAGKQLLDLLQVAFQLDAAAAVGLLARLDYVDVALAAVLQRLCGYQVPCCRYW